MAGPTLPPRYEPLRPLGKGGGGEVWAVRDRITNRTVALKALGDDADEREGLALVREAVALLVLSQGLARGAGASVWANLGILSGNAVYFALSGTGLGVVLVASYEVF